MNAIENGGTSNTIMKRLRELEIRQEELERQILIEKSKTTVQLTEKQIREFYMQALSLEPKLLINYLVKQITLYDDKIEIQFNAPIKVSPDDESRRGFSFYSKTVKNRNVCVITINGYLFHVPLDASLSGTCIEANKGETQQPDLISVGFWFAFGNNSLTRSFLTSSGFRGINRLNIDHNDNGSLTA